MLKMMLTTSGAGQLIPNLKKEFGSDRPIDIVGSLSTTFIEDKLENFSQSGVMIKKSGVVSLKINTSFQLLV